jgi:hypothetical protein
MFDIDLDYVSDFTYYVMVFYIYFMALIGGGYYINYLLYTIITDQVTSHYTDTKKILYAINERFDIMDNNLIDSLDYKKMLEEIEEIELD